MPILGGLDPSKNLKLKPKNSYQPILLDYTVQV